MPKSIWKPQISKWKDRGNWSLVYFLGPRRSETAYKKTANNEGHLYQIFCIQLFYLQEWRYSVQNSIQKSYRLTPLFQLDCRRSRFESPLYLVFYENKMLSKIVCWSSKSWKSALKAFIKSYVLGVMVKYKQKCLFESRFELTTFKKIPYV